MADKLNPLDVLADLDFENVLNPPAATHIHEHSNSRDDDRVWWVRYGAIAELPPSREKLVLARKACCVFPGLSSTQSLKTYGIVGEEAIYGRLLYLTWHGPGAGLSHGFEPSDHTDKSKNPVSLEAFCKEWAAKNDHLLRRTSRR